MSNSDKKNIGKKTIVWLIEAHQSAAKRADPQRTRMIFGDGQNGIAAEALRLTGQVAKGRASSLRTIKAAQAAALCANPKRAVTRFVKRADILVRQLGLKTSEAVAFSIITTQPTAQRPRPKRSRAIFVQCQNDVATQSLRAFAPIASEAIAAAFIATQTATARANPQRVGMIYQQRPNIVDAQRRGIARIVAIARETRPIIPIQSVVGADPEKPALVLRDTLGTGGRQSLLDGDGFQPERIPLRARAKASCAAPKHDRPPYAPEL